MPRPLTQREKRRRRLLRNVGIIYPLLTVALFIYLGPVIIMLVGSLKPDARVLAEAGSLKAFVPSEASLENYFDVFDRVDFGRYLFNSVFITGSIVVSAIFINSMAGYSFARIRWRGRNALFVLVLALMILPLEAIAVPLFYQVTLFGWRDTYIAQILPFIANPFAIYLFYTFFLGMPRELEECARIDGAGYFRAYWQIIMPNARPAIAAVTIVLFLFYWQSYLWPLMVTIGEEVRPLPVGIAVFHTLPPLQWGDIMAFGVMMVAPVLVVFFIFQRWFIQGLVTSGLKG
ncbi:MAG: carbohydrate ABC transporter permease [Candidatus Hydrogenedentota bacterium]